MMRIAIAFAAVLLVSGCAEWPWAHKPPAPQPVVAPPPPPIPQPAPPPPRVSHARPHRPAPKETAALPADSPADQRTRCNALAKQREKDAKMIGVDGSTLQKVHHDYFTECMAASP